MTVIQVLVGQSGVFRAEYQTDTIAFEQWRNFVHYGPGRLFQDTAPTPAGGGADQKMKWGDCLTRVPAALNIVNQMGRFVGRHLQHSFLIRHFIGDNNKLPNTEIEGYTGRCPDIFRVTRGDQDDSRAAQPPMSNHDGTLKRNAGSVGGGFFHLKRLLPGLFEFFASRAR